MTKNRSDEEQPKNYEVGYGKPPKSGRFKKGTSGNPSGRPKTPSDADAEWKRELTSKMIILEKGKRKAITKSVAYKRQMVNKAISGDIRAARHVTVQEHRLREKDAEQERNCPRNPHRTPSDMSDDELLSYIINELKKSTSAEELTEALTVVAQRLRLTKPEL